MCNEHLENLQFTCELDVRKWEKCMGVNQSSVIQWIPTAATTTPEQKNRTYSNQCTHAHTTTFPLVSSLPWYDNGDFCSCFSADHRAWYMPSIDISAKRTMCMCSALALLKLSHSRYARSSQITHYQSKLIHINLSPIGAHKKSDDSENENG